MKKIKFALFKNLILSSVLLVTIILLTFSWFTQNSEASADGIYIQCTTPPGVEIAVVEPGTTPKDDDYKTGTFTLNAEEIEFLKSYKLADITSNGVDFYKPTLTQGGNSASPEIGSDAPWEIATPNLHYISFDLYCRSKSAVDVFFTKNCKFDTKAQYDSLGGSVDTCSHDAVVGAARFSVFDTEKNLKFLWIPRPDIYLECDIDKVPTKVLTNQNDVTGPSYKHNYYTVESDNSKIYHENDIDKTKLVTSTSVGTNDYVMGDDQEILQLNKKQADDSEYYAGHVTCNMWIEGEDSEARRALMDGNFSINLELTI